jgi:predicted amidohydrolase YtcJ
MKIKIRLSIRNSWFLLVLFLVSCQPETKEKADLILLNTKVYTVDGSNTIEEAVAVKDGKIVQIGLNVEILLLEGDSTKVLDLSSYYVFPGFAEGHAHIMGIGANLINVDLMDAQSYDEVIARVKERAETTPKGEWIIGRGWHQDKWTTQPELMLNGFPTHHDLSKAVPDHPVWMSHASGHAGLANAKAMEVVGLIASTLDPFGGEIFRDVSGLPTGLMNEMASELILKHIPEESPSMLAMKLTLAIDEALRNGITSFHEAGSDKAMIDAYETFAKENQLKLRFHVMLSGSDTALLNARYKLGPQRDLYDDHLSISAIKLYADGALGSRGAWLLEAYSDASDLHGHNTTSMDEIEEVVQAGTLYGFQVCTHAIGDRANREVLDIYERAFEKYPELASDRRFRIEHAQHIDPEDIPRFAALGVIPAMQAIHMSSDRPWAINRLGKKRIESGAYMWRSLIDQGSKIVNGTDAPVEPINPMANFYASVTRKTLAGKPDGGYEPEQKMTREEALRSFTIWAAFGAFMEDKVGSIEIGKLADFTILDSDIMTIPEDEILNTKVVLTIIGGEVVYSKN